MTVFTTEQIQVPLTLQKGPGLFPTLSTLTLSSKSKGVSIQWQ